MFRLGPVKLFYKMPYFDDTILHLQNQRYLVPQIDCSTVETEPDFYNSILFALGVQETEYKNIKPIQFSDLVTYTDFTDKKGIVLAFRNFDAFYNQFPDGAHLALAILAEYQYRWL